MARIVVKIEPVQVDGETRHQAVCYTPGCTLGEDNGPWTSRPQVVKAAADEVARFHRQDHRRPTPVLGPHSTGTRPERLRRVETVPLPGDEPDNGPTWAHL